MSNDDIAKLSKSSAKHLKLTRTTNGLHISIKCPPRPPPWRSGRAVQEAAKRRGGEETSGGEAEMEMCAGKK